MKKIFLFFISFLIITIVTLIILNQTKVINIDNILNPKKKNIKKDYNFDELIDKSSTTETQNKLKDESTIKSSVPSPVQSTVSSSVQSTLQSSVSSSVQSPVSSTISSSVQSPVQSTIQSPVQSTIQSPLQSTVQLPVQSTIQSPVQSTVQLPVQSPVQSSTTTKNKSLCKDYNDNINCTNNGCTWDKTKCRDPICEDYSKKNYATNSFDTNGELLNRLIDTCEKGNCVWDNNECRDIKCVDYNVNLNEYANYQFDSKEKFKKWLEDGCKINNCLWDKNTCKDKDSICKPQCVKDNGICKNKKCECNPGYSGKQCETDICNKCNVSNTESKLRKDGGCDCKCKPGYSGENCETDICNKCNVSNTESKLRKDGGCDCKCKPRFYGDDCSNECTECASGKAICDLDNKIDGKDYGCKCINGYGDTNCSKCIGKPCSDNIGVKCEIELPLNADGDNIYDECNKQTGKKRKKFDITRQPVIPSCEASSPASTICNFDHLKCENLPNYPPLENCPVNCEERDVGWTVCDVNSGQQYKKFNIDVEPKNGGQLCTDTNQDTWKQTSGNFRNCDVDCSFSSTALKRKEQKLCSTLTVHHTEKNSGKCPGFIKKTNAYSNVGSPVESCISDVPSEILIESDKKQNLYKDLMQKKAEISIKIYEKYDYLLKKLYSIDDSYFVDNTTFECRINNNLKTCLVSLNYKTNKFTSNRPVGKLIKCLYAKEKLNELHKIYILLSNNRQYDRIGDLFEKLPTIINPDIPPLKSMSDLFKEYFGAEADITKSEDDDTKNYYLINKKTLEEYDKKIEQLNKCKTNGVSSGNKDDDIMTYNCETDILSDLDLGKEIKPGDKDIKCSSGYKHARDYRGNWKSYSDSRCARSYSQENTNKSCPARRGRNEKKYYTKFTQKLNLEDCPSTYNKAQVLAHCGYPDSINVINFNAKTGPSRNYQFPKCDLACGLLTQNSPYYKYNKCSNVTDIDSLSKISNFETNVNTKFSDEYSKVLTESNAASTLNFKSKSSNHLCNSNWAPHKPEGFRCMSRTCTDYTCESSITKSERVRGRWGWTTITRKECTKKFCDGADPDISDKANDNYKMDIKRFKSNLKEFVKIDTNAPMQASVYKFLREKYVEYTDYFTDDQVNTIITDITNSINDLKNNYISYYKIEQIISQLKRIIIPKEIGKGECNSNYDLYDLSCDQKSSPTSGPSASGPSASGPSASGSSASSCKTENEKILECASYCYNNRANCNKFSIKNNQCKTTKKCYNNKEIKSFSINSKTYYNIGEYEDKCVNDCKLRCRNGNTEGCAENRKKVTCETTSGDIQECLEDIESLKCKTSDKQCEIKEDDDAKFYELKK